MPTGIDIAEIINKQLLDAGITEVSYEFFSHWLPIIDDVWVGYTTASSTVSNLFGTILIYDFGSMKIKSYYKTREIPEVAELGYNTSINLVGSNGMFGSGLVYTVDNGNFYLAMYGNDNNNPISILLVFDLDTFIFKKILPLVGETANSTGLHFNATNGTFNLIIKGDLMIRCGLSKMEFSTYTAIRDLSTGEVTGFKLVVASKTWASAIGGSFSMFIGVVHLRDDMYAIVWNNSSNYPGCNIWEITQDGLYTPKSNVTTASNSSGASSTIRRVWSNSVGDVDYFAVAAEDRVVVYFKVEGTLVTYLGTATNGTTFNPHTGAILGITGSNSDTVIQVAGHSLSRYNEQNQINKQGTVGTKYRLALSGMPVKSMVGITSSGNSVSLFISANQTLFLKDGSIITQTSVFGNLQITKWVKTKLISGYTRMEDTE